MPNSQPAYLPVYVVHPPEVDQFQRNLAQFLGFSEAESIQLGELKIYRRGSSRLDVNRNTGEVWLANEARLWKPQFSDEARRAASTRVSKAWMAAQARTQLAPLIASRLTPPIATDSVRHPVVEAPLDSVAVRCNLLNKVGPKFSQRKPFKLDSYVAFTSYMEVPDPDGGSAQVKARMVGRGLRRGITFGTDGAILNIHGAAERSLQRLPDEIAIPMKESQAQFRESVSDAQQIRTLSSELAYELCDTGDKTILWPVWLHRASIMGREGRVDLPIVALPASNYGPVEKCPPLPPVKPSSLPNPFGKTGAWWLEDAGIHAERNANGFLDGMRNSNWEILANRGNDPKLKEDWLSKAATAGVDLADLVFYAGHANMKGWCFNKLGTCAMVSAKLVGDNDSKHVFYGQRLKWLAVCACGPLQDKQNGTVNADAFKRWGNMFDGLRTLLGFATQISDRCHIGERFADRLRSHTVIDAWLRAARENQVGGTTASTCAISSAMYAFKKDEPEPLLDRFDPSLPQMGSKKPTVFTAIWTPA